MTASEYERLTALARADLAFVRAELEALKWGESKKSSDAPEGWSEPVVYG